MRHDRDEVVLEPLELTRLRDVASDDDENFAAGLRLGDPAVRARQPQRLPGLGHDLYVAGQAARCLDEVGPTLEQQVTALRVARTKQPEVTRADNLFGDVAGHGGKAG